MKMTLLICALVLAAGPAFAEEDSTLKKAVKLDTLKKADSKDVESLTKLKIGQNASDEQVKNAVKLDALKGADDEDVKNAAKLKMLQDAKKD